MQNNEDKVGPYAQRLVDLWERMVRTIGIHTVNVLLDRAIWEVSQQHPELALIEHNDNGLSFEALSKSLAAKSEGEIAAAFGDLNTELMLILARLLGKEMAQRLEEELQARAGMERRAAKGGKQHRAEEGER